MKPKSDYKLIQEAYDQVPSGRISDGSKMKLPTLKNVKIIGGAGGDYVEIDAEASFPSPHGEDHSDTVRHLTLNMIIDVEQERTDEQDYGDPSAPDPVGDELLDHMFVTSCSLQNNRGAILSMPNRGSLDLTNNDEFVKRVDELVCNKLDGGGVGYGLSLKQLRDDHDINIDPEAFMYS